MMQPTPCPDTNTLASLLSGRLGYGDVERLSQHLEECPSCTHVAERLGIEDPLAAALRTPGPVELHADEMRINRLIESLCCLKPQSHCSESSSSPETQWDVSEVLQPANRAGFVGRIGPYWVQSRIGSGGMGEVYLARQERPDRDVALKILRTRPGHERDLLARFRAEADAAARLHHPNVVQIYEAGETAEAAFIAMELVGGESLAARLARAVLAPREAAALLTRLARAVQFAHDRGVIHRDLKPSNILLEADGTPKLSDFGLAKVVDDADADHTRTGAVLGTPAYMSPEQASASKTVGPLSDVYGLGAVLYECLTGRPPFKGASPLDTLQQVLAREPIPPRRLQPGIPRDLQTICLKCLEKEPNRRFPSAAELADDLDRFLRGEAIRARPVSAIVRGWKWARRRPTSAALLVVSGLLAAGAVALTLVYTNRLHLEVARANTNAIEAQRQQERAAANYHSARQAISLILDRLNKKRMTENPRLLELRRDQLEDALMFYEGMLGGLDEADPAIQLDTALTAVQAGGLQHQLGRVQQARDTLQRALALMEALPTELRTRPDCREGLIHACKCLAFLNDGRPAVAEAFFLKARAEVEELTRLDPSNANWQNGLAEVEHDLGDHYAFGVHQAERSILQYQRAIAIREGLLSRTPDNEVFIGSLAEDFINLGLLYDGLKKPEDASSAFLRADQLLRPLVDSHPEDYPYALSLAALYINWGNLLVSRDFPNAVAKLDRAVELADAALAHEPQHLQARWRSIQAHGSRARARAVANQLEESLVDWNRVVDLADGDKRIQYRVERAVLLIRAGRRSQAIAEAYAFAADPKISQDVLYNTACILALGAEPGAEALPLSTLASVAAAEIRASDSIKILRRLRDAGFFNKPGNTGYLSEDTDFAFIRSRPDFQALLNQPRQ